MVDINQLLGQLEQRPGAPYYSPAHLLNAPGHMSGIPYTMQGLPMASWPGVSYGSPEAAIERPIYTVAAQQIPQVLGTQNATAPTAGIYTGVEDHCG